MLYRCFLVGLTLVGCGSDPSNPATQQQFAVTTAQGVSGVVALTAPLAPQAQMLQGSATDGAVRALVQEGISGPAGVDGSSCVSFAWSGLSVTITFNQCVTRSTGQTLNGSITLSAMLVPTQLSLTLSQLTLGSDSLDGSLTLSVNEGSPTTISANLSYQSASGSAHLLLDRVTVTTGATGISLSGSGSTSTGSLSGDFTLNSVTWARGQCLPSSGSLVLTVAGGPPLTVTFLPTTPTQGEVQINGQPQVVFAPCGSR